MSSEPRDSQLHANMTSLKATHAAHRVASGIHSTPTEKLKEIVDKHDASLKAKARTIEYRYWQPEPPLRKAASFVFCDTPVPELERPWRKLPLTKRQRRVNLLWSVLDLLLLMMWLTVLVGVLYLCRR